LTERQATNVANALTRSTTVQELFIGLYYCPLVALCLVVVYYIKSSPLLKVVEIWYEQPLDNQQWDSQETQDLYNSKVGDLSPI
jgi:hypothetical protein